MASSIESVGSFSIVLAECFAAVGLATLAPATVVAALKAAQAADTAAGGDLMATLPALNPVQGAASAIASAAKEIDAIDLLVPKRAKIHAEFQLQANLVETVEASVSVPLEVVSVNAGFSALYSSTSSNRITLDVEFELANFSLRGPGAGESRNARVPVVSPDESSRTAPSAPGAGASAGG